ncbi:hypothetical protein [Actinomadura rayongensis]|uniref:Uncharacterized protein n=1 Tax=Actinomadura rayongensis TaxID=1429076 RepID=A0A6I4WHH9_9ACTN|nr:hypothetical protein [Actinomadura rayongensis]MXQ66042.1 hypothetical protein [Actinomadura rayongensis]
MPGEMIVSWSPCVCGPSVGLGEGRQGHRTYLCLACKDERRTTLCYLPAHVPGF